MADKENKQIFEKSPDEISRYALENDIINVSDISEQIEMNERKKYLENHPYSIWEGSDGLCTQEYVTISAENAAKEKKDENSLG